MPDLPVSPDIDALLTPAARAILSVGRPDAYADLVVGGDGAADAQRLLTDARPELLVGQPIVRADAADAVLAGLWLWHDWLHESHTISQGIASATGSYWHA